MLDDHKIQIIPPEKIRLTVCAGNTLSMTSSALADPDLNKSFHASSTYFEYHNCCQI